MPYSEVYSGLQLNMIDGQVNPVFAIERQKFHEVTSWLVFPGHASFITTCAASRQFFSELSTKRQELVADIMRELDDYIFKVQREFQTARLKTIRRDKKQPQSELFVSGDLSDFIDSLDAQEREELIDDNPYLKLVPELSAEERDEFERATEAVRDVFLKIGGPRSEEVLDLLLKEAQQQQPLS
jgi:TRAP-type C4-dicarboxylate transport system substrate-binding protein